MTASTNPALQRAAAFAQRFGLRLPVLLAPMAGACPVGLSVAVAQAGGMAACGALLLDAAALADWVARYRQAASGPVQINLWIPDPAPLRDADHEARLRNFLAYWGPPVAADAGDTRAVDFALQCQALLAVRPTAVSSIMGLYPEPIVQQFKAAGIAWFANVTTVAEARAAQAAGADVIVAQGAEAGGHRGVFDAARAEASATGLFALLPQVVDAVRVPVVATGGIADGRGVAAALLLGASAVQVGTALLRSPEAGIAPAWAAALAGVAPDGTQLTRAFSGRLGRALATDYVRATTAGDAPRPAPYPVQRALTAGLRKAAEQAGDVQRMQAWAGQAAGLARAVPASQIVQDLWHQAQELLN